MKVAWTLEVILAINLNATTIFLQFRMFLHALMTGFSDIKSDMKTFLSDKTVSDETLFEQLNKTTNSVNERKKKLQSASRTARVNEITSSDVSQNNNKTEKSKKIKSYCK